MTTTVPSNSSPEAVHRSPPLGILAIVFTTLFLAGVAANAIMTGGAPYPVPYNPVPEIQDYFTRFPDAMRVVSFLQFGASIPLGLFTATVVSRLLFHRVNVAGVHIALFGGSLGIRVPRPFIVGDVGAVAARGRD